MRTTNALPAFAGVLALAFGTGALAAGKPDTGPMSAVRGFLNAFNKGDTAAAEAVHEADVSIIDEVPPHHWQGPGAFKAWAADLEKADKAAGNSDQKVTLGKAERNVVDGDTAYVVVQATYTYKVHGKPTVEPARMAFALKKEEAGWKISAWTWAGTVPHAVAPKPAAAPAAAPGAAPPAPAAPPAKKP